uniref:Uncharacterized protein n=1 Tax=Periophthalmus magnuspinnatus TaxID=409849 RepID=A0A3B4ABH0_9GOBI
MGSEDHTSNMSQKISSLSRSNSSSSSKHDSRQIEKGKLHGCIDVGLSVMAIKKKAKCIDLDAEENIYHLKIKSQELFDEWVSKLRHHRVYRQNEIALYPNEKTFFSPLFPSPTSTNTTESVSIRRRQSSVHSPGAFPVGCNSQAKVTAWLQSSDDMAKCSKISVCESYLLELSHLLQSMEVLHRTYSAPSIQALQHTTMKSALTSLTSERERLRQCVETETCPPTSPQVVGLKNALSTLQALAQNSELRERLSKIHAESHIVEPTLINITAPVQKQESMDDSHHLVHQVSNESRASIAESLSEFFDAHEVLLSASSSENEVSEDDSYISDISDNISMDNFSNETELVENGSVLYQRRSCLPSPSPNSSTISLWNILRNNIGKDLSKVAMPVHLNEPLNTLQRLCEELEYSELLDQAASTQDPFERMVYISTFVVSGYASSYYRTGGKPFNPVLGETYECDRPDKGFRFLAEQQVSHHPPISACHAESKNFIFWQVRCKNKFWGKSMEIVPIGTTHVTLPAKYWNSSVNEIEGTVTDKKGKVVHRLFGKWHEAVYCGDPPTATCVWRAFEQYYGFTKFAIELNEPHPSLKLLLPPTDTRLRVDQRLLEEGKLEEAEEQKQRIEDMQRQRRKTLEESNVTHEPKFFKSKDDTWVSNNTYWELRADPGFGHIDFPTLW